MKKYKEKMKKYEGNVKELICRPRYGLWDLENSPGGGERYADADRIPERAPST